MTFSRALFAALLVASNAVAAPIDARNWQTHPEIVLIRSLCRSVDQAVRDGAMQRRGRTYDCVPGETERFGFVDAEGRVRKLVRKGGSDDSALSVEEWFDDAGQLRFAFFVAGAVNGSSAHVRMYFDAAGKRVWEQRDVTGPGYTWAFEAWLSRRAPKDVLAPAPICAG
jgi:hypothetical protein